jgi:hypothetical protein
MVFHPNNNTVFNEKKKYSSQPSAPCQAKRLENSLIATIGSRGLLYF